MKTKDLTLVPIWSLPPGHSRLEGERHAVVKELRRGIKRRELRPITPLYMNNDSSVVVIVERLKAPAPRWRKPAIIASVATATLTGVAWAGYLIAAVTASIVESSGPVILGFVLLGGLVLVLARPDRIIEGTFRARIR